MVVVCRETRINFRLIKCGFSASFYIKQAIRQILKFLTTTHLLSKSILKHSKRKVENLRYLSKAKPMMKHNLYHYTYPSNSNIYEKTCMHSYHGTTLLRFTILTEYFKSIKYLHSKYNFSIMKYKFHF